MSTGRTQSHRSTSPVRPRNTSARRTARRGPRFRLGVWLAVPLAVFLALTFGAWGQGIGGGSSSHRAFIRYVVVDGDTPSSIASSFASDSTSVMRQAGVSAPTEPLLGGTTLRIDASGLWDFIRAGPGASNASLVEASARRMNLEPALALAVAWQESKLDQSARSGAGAIGIMQVEPDTARLASRDLGQPIDESRAADNVVAGIFWLRSLLKSYRGSRELAVASYYEGPGNLARHGYLAGTGAYVDHVLQIRSALLAAAPDLRL